MEFGLRDMLLGKGFQMANSTIHWWEKVPRHGDVLKKTKRQGGYANIRSEVFIKGFVCTTS